MNVTDETNVTVTLACSYFAIDWRCLRVSICSLVVWTHTRTWHHRLIGLTWDLYLSISMAQETTGFQGKQPYVVRVMCSYLIDILQCSYIQALELYLFSRLKIYLYQYFYFLAVNIFLDSISVTNGQHPWDDSRASAWRWYPCLNFCWMT